MLSDVTKTPRDFLLQRPDDFMAEMAKSDDHMQKVVPALFEGCTWFLTTLQVRYKLLTESKGAAQQEERKKQRQQKVFGKEARTCFPLSIPFEMSSANPTMLNLGARITVRRAKGFAALSCLTSTQVQTKKLQEKEQAKRHAVDSVTQWRKDRKSGRIQGGLMFSSAGIALRATRRP
jgi:hypothetical protein